MVLSLSCQLAPSDAFSECSQLKCAEKSLGTVGIVRDAPLIAGNRQHRSRPHSGSAVLQAQPACVNFTEPEVTADVATSFESMRIGDGEHKREPSALLLRITV
jgi:hypothetical protein